MTSKLSYNINVQGLQNPSKLLSHLQVIKPKAVVVMNGIALARVIKSQNPATMVIHREWPDDDIYLRKSPAQWIADKRAQVGTEDLWVYTTNEPGYDAKIIAWHEEVIKLNFASLHPLKLVILNLSAGVPKPEEWSQADTLLRLAAKYRDKVIIGLHEYFGGIATSGFVGGNPDDIRYHPNYIVKSNWPLKDAAKGLTKYHCGRYKFLEDYCVKNGIAVPRMILTEHGADFMGDVGTWLKSLKVTSPYTSARGYKSLQTQWQNWYGDWSHDQAYFEQLKYLDQNIYIDSPVEAQLIFSYGHIPGGDWEQFDMENASEFMGMMEKYVKTVVPIVVPPVKIPTPSLPPTPAPVPSTPVPPTPTVPAQAVLPSFPSDFNDRAIKVTISSPSNSKLNVRLKPTTSSDIVTGISAATDAMCIMITNLKSSETIVETISGTKGTWVPILTSDNIAGWLFSGFAKIEAKTPPLPDPVIIAEPTPTPMPTPTPTPVPPITLPVVDLEKRKLEIETMIKDIEKVVAEAQAKLDAVKAEVEVIRQLLK